MSSIRSAMTRFRTGDSVCSWMIFNPSNTGKPAFTTSERWRAKFILSWMEIRSNAREKKLGLFMDDTDNFFDRREPFRNSEKRVLDHRRHPVPDRSHFNFRCTPVIHDQLPDIVVHFEHFANRE